MNMRHGDLVTLRHRGGRKNWIAIQLTRTQILKHHLNVLEPKTGLYLMSGYWYDGGVLSHRPYGKIDGGIVDAEALRYRVTKRVRGHRAAYKHLR
jgi:hypothetical protein